jgi:2-furoyl-CoA dehydrogenase large subunit
VQYRAIAVTSNKMVQEAVRAFGQSPTDYAIERGIARSTGTRCGGAT